MNSLSKTLTIVALLVPLAAFGGEAYVIKAEAKKSIEGVFSFRVTVEHADEGWDHYADRWDVLDTEGELLGSRVLMHPHVGEQPFTRSLQEVKVPPGVIAVILQAHDSVHGLGGKTLRIDLNE